MEFLERMFSPEPPERWFYFDDEVRGQIFGLIRSAEEFLYLVSPYNKHPVQLREQLTAAIERRVRVTMLYRDEKDQREGVAYLERLGAKVLPVERLHSKIYMNESTALASSMNLLESSFENSSDFCFRIDFANNGALYNELAKYVKDIQSRAERRNPSAAPDGPTRAKAAAPKTAPAKAVAKSAPRPRSAPKAAAAGATGHCIRCGVGISLNLAEPLCPKDYKTWKRYQDPDYEENYCHVCGEEHNTSMAKPVCRRCWRAVVQA